MQVPVYILTAFCMLALVAVLLHPFSALIHLYVLVLIFICGRCCYFIQPVWILFSLMGWLLSFLGPWFIFMNFWKSGDLSFQVFSCWTWVGGTCGVVLQVGGSCPRLIFHPAPHESINCRCKSKSLKLQYIGQVQIKVT